jgi:hypothetical protein
MPRANGEIHGLFINKDPSAPHTVSVALKGSSSRGVAGMYSFELGDTSLRKRREHVSGSSFTLTLSPYSLTTLELP